MSITYKFAERFTVTAPDSEYDVVFENVFERRNTRYDNPMVTIGQNYLKPLCKQRITIIPGRNNVFRDYKTLEAELDNEASADFRQMLIDEPYIKMWFVKDELSYAAKYGKLI